MSIIDIPDDLAEVRTGPIPWDQFTAELLEEVYSPPLRSISTRRGMARMFRFVSELEVLEVDAQTGETTRRPAVLTTADMTVRTIKLILAARAGRNESPHTTKATLRCFAAACSAAVASGYLSVSPFVRFPLRKCIRVGKPRGRRHLTRVELATLLGYMKRTADEAPIGWKKWKCARIYCMVILAAHSGIRLGELEHLEVSDIDLDGRILHVRPHARHRLKTETSDDIVPLPRAVVPHIREWLAIRLSPPVFPPPEQIPWLFPGARGRGPWTGGPRGAKPLDVLKAAAVAAGIGDVSFQMIRRSLATHLRAFGVSGGMAAQILRHSVSVDEAFYLQDDRDNLRDAVADVSFE